MNAAAQTSLVSSLNKDSSASPAADAVRDPLDRLPWLKCEVTLQIPARQFSVGDLLTLAPGAIVETATHHTADLPLYVNGKLIGWAGFEVIRDRIAVRLTELA